MILHMSSLVLQLPLDTLETLLVVLGMSLDCRTSSFCMINWSTFKDKFYFECRAALIFEYSEESDSGDCKSWQGCVYTSRDIPTSTMIYDQKKLRYQLVYADIGAQNNTILHHK